MDIRTGADIDINAHDAADSSRVWTEGIVAGVVGALTIAVWFFILDVINGHPFYTPSVLGTAFFRGGAGLDAPENLPVSFEMVMVFTWVHLLIFALIGGVAARLLELVEHTPHIGFGIVLLFVIFECGFVTASVAFADSTLRALGVVPVLVGNLLAAVAMGIYFRRRHPALLIEP